MLIALLCESEMKLADETIEIILDKVSHYYHTSNEEALSHAPFLFS